MNAPQLFYTVVCPPLRLDNGNIEYNTSLLYEDLYGSTGYSAGTMASFLCDDLYERVGNNSVLCQESGDWSGPAPICSSSNLIMSFILIL